MLRSILAWILLSAVVGAQSKPQFEVATIKPASPDSQGRFIRIEPGGRVRVTGMTLKDLIVFAWGVQPYEVMGGPNWIDSDRYDINAKPETPPERKELGLLVQSLLEERFQLKTHRETKDLSVFALVLAKKDGKTGPKLVESKDGTCEEFGPGHPPPPPEPGKPPARGCGMMRMGLSQFLGYKITMASFVEALSRMLGKRVLNKTGLDGNFDVSIEFSPDEIRLAQLPPDAPRPETTGPSIFTAIQEQLGLRLDSQKAPVETIVVDRAEKPGEN